MTITKDMLLKFAAHLESDDASTDEFLFEGMTFQEALELMDITAKAIREYAANKFGKS